MKVYTMTFHWATNYGAVLQAYALQHYLESQGYEAEIINYVPKRFKKTFGRCLLSNPKKYKANFQEWKKEKAIKIFRKKYLHLTRIYSTHDELLSAEWENATYICGSDQIWNSYFTLQGEGGVTLAYYLDFVPANARKISYAASFGMMSFDPTMAAVVTKAIKDFNKISVRESSAIKMLQGIGFSATLVCDPVFLISSEDWENMRPSSRRKVNGIFKYMLHQPCEDNEQISKYIVSAFGDMYVSGESFSVGEWLNAIFQAEMVVTNSFHAVAFSLIFHRPFIAIVQEGNGMNDRLTTLLSSVGLLDRIVDKFEEEKLSSLITKSINWNDVEEKIKQMRMLGIEFLRLALEEI